MRRYAWIVAVAAVFALAGPVASASAGAVTCTPGIAARESVKAASVFYVAAPDKVRPGVSAELKTFGQLAPNSTTLFTHCDVTGQNAVAFTYTWAGVTYAIQNNVSDLNRVLFEPVALAGPSLAQFWAWSGTNPYTFRNLKSGRYLRVPNSGAAEYAPVVAGASPVSWGQG